MGASTDPWDFLFDFTVPYRVSYSSSRSDEGRRDSLKNELHGDSRPYPLGNRAHGIVSCSRFCSCQSTQEPQGSTGFRKQALSCSIISTYFHAVSTGFHKRSNLLWEQRVGGSNPSAPTITSHRYFKRCSRFRSSICFFALHLNREYPQPGLSWRHHWIGPRLFSFAHSCS